MAVVGRRFPASQYNNLTRYVKIAAFLPDKTITEVAKRYQWMVVRVPRRPRSHLRSALTPTPLAAWSGHAGVAAVELD